MHSFQQLVTLFDEQLQTASIFPTTLPSLYEPCNYFLGIGGKRVRPISCLMANELFGDLTEDAWNAAFGVELFHNFTLMHDDIMDNAPLRRGKQTVLERNGLTAGILCGDVVCIKAYQQLSKIKNSLPQVLQLFNTTAIEVCEGQQLDMEFEQRDEVTVEEYLEMITLKTSVLLACSLKMGAILGGASEANAQKIYEFGINTGIAFQLKDDYLDAFGDPNKTGKQVGGDILANKKTFLALHASKQATNKQQHILAEHNESNPTSKIERTLEYFVKTASDKACKDAIAFYSTKAFECLEEVIVPASRKKPMQDLATFLLERDY